MRKTVFVMMCLGWLAMLSQPLQVSHRVRLLPSWGKPVYGPVLSCTGDKLLFTDADASSLYLYDCKTENVITVSESDGSGIDAFFDTDGKVYYVTQKRDDRNLIYRAGNTYDPVTGRHNVVLEPRHGAVHPVVALQGGGLKGSEDFYKSPAMSRAAVYVEGDEVVIIRNGVEHRYTPVKSDAGYVWPSLSPDGQRVALVVAGHGILVLDLEGNILADLGNYEMPSWLNDEYIVAQNATDDGYQFTSSQIVLLKADGSYIQPLTSPTSMTMQPTAAAGKVAYVSIDGHLYLMDLN